VPKPKVTKKEILRFLRINHLASLATVSPKGQPESSDVYFGVDESFHLFFPTGTDSRKYKNLMKHPRVALSITDERQQVTLQMEGEATLIKKVRKDSKAAKLLTEVLTPGIFEILKLMKDPLPPVLKIPNGELALFKVTVDWMRWADFNQLSSQDEGDYFLQILP
jgi:uncharacterized pyridoxamine 5'-phosphate oxidase family protein